MLGSYSAGNHIATVRGLNSVSADIAAGSVGLIESWGDIAGNFTATNGILNVHAGGSVSSDIKANSDVQAWREHDHYLLSDYPTVTTSLHAVHARIAAMLKEVQLGKDEIEFQRAGELRTLQAEKTWLAADMALDHAILADIAASVVAEVAMAEVGAEDDVARAEADAHAAGVRAMVAIGKEADALLADLRNNKEQTRSQLDVVQHFLNAEAARHKQTATILNAAVENLQEVIASVQEARQQVLTEERQERQHRASEASLGFWMPLTGGEARRKLVLDITHWVANGLSNWGAGTGNTYVAHSAGFVAFFARMGGAIVAGTVDPIGTISDLYDYTIGDATLAYRQAIQNQQSTASAVHQAAGVFITSVTGVRLTFEAFTDQNTVTAERYNRDIEDRIAAGAMGVAQATGMAAGVGKIAGLTKGAVRTNAQLVQDIGARAEAWGARKGLTGTAREIGTAKHVHARDVLRRYQKMYGDRGLVAERSFLNGDPVRYGKKGSVRIDVLDVNTGAVWDYKFGSTPMSAAQRAKILRHGPGVTTITELRYP